MIDGNIGAEGDTVYNVSPSRGLRFACVHSSLHGDSDGAALLEIKKCSYKMA
jgi:hypothetical protein